MPQLNIACVSYGRIRALLDGRVGIGAYKPKFHSMPAGKIPAACFEQGVIDIGEVSPTYLARAIDRGDDTYIGLPIYLSAGFRHGCIFISDKGAIHSVEDLRGRRIGVSDFFGTSVIWARGVLQDDYDIDLAAIDWVLGLTEAGAVYQPLPKLIHKSFRIEQTAPEVMLVDMMRSGELDAIIAPRPTRDVVNRNGSRRLFEDYRALEEEYHRSTGIFPVLHIVVMKRKLAEDDPDLPAHVFKAFELAKNLSLAEIEQTAFVTPAFPWMAESIERAHAVMGPDIWPYGRDAGRATIEAFLRHCNEQGVVGRLLSMEELFPEKF